MARELGGSQISALLESVPGIVNVLRNPVADALVGMIRAGAGLEEFSHEHANELVQYAVRRGLVPSSEGDQVLQEVEAAVPKKRSRSRGAAKKKAPVRKAPVKTQPVAKKPFAKNPFAKKPVAKKPVAKKPVAKKPVAKKPVAKKPVAKKPVAKKPVAKKPVKKVRGRPAKKGVSRVKR
jgi:polyhydroxyalkanoate synthesis regulator phasin